jgi:N-acetyl sugar amidotransferase
MDTTDLYIEFDDDGVCNHCRYFDKVVRPALLPEDQKQTRLSQLIKDIKRVGAKRKYDCVIGLSGGKDSSYVCYLAMKHNLRALIVHFDNGWDSELAIQNIENIVKTTGFDYYNYIVDWHEFRDLQLAYFKASVVDIEAPTDLGIFSVIPKVASRMNIRYILMGQNPETESIMGKEWNFPYKNYRANMLAIHKEYGEMSLRTFPMLTPLERRIHKSIKRITAVNLLDYEDCNYKRIGEKLYTKFNWKDYDVKHGESVFTKFYQGYVLLEKFRFDKRRAHLSSLINSGQVDRSTALAEIERNIYTPENLLEEREYVISKWQLEVSEFDRIMALPPVSHYIYPVKGEPLKDVVTAKIVGPAVVVLTLIFRFIDMLRRRKG